jgi:predicted  nucleic acid-binding Zn-ribbon protein
MNHEQDDKDREVITSERDLRLLENERDCLKRELAEARESLINQSALKEKIARLEQAIQLNGESWERKHGHATEERDAARRDLNKLLAERDTLKAQLGELHEVNLSLVAEKETLRRDLDKALDLANERRRVIGEMQTTIDRVSKERDEYNDAFKAMKKQHDQAVNSKVILDSQLGDQRKRVSELECELGKRDASIERLEDEVASMKWARRSAEDAARNWEDAYTRAQRAKEEAKREAASHVARVNAELETAKWRLKMLDEVLEAQRGVAKEVARARGLHPTAEGLAVVLIEEVGELLDELLNPEQPADRVREEGTQVAAMAVRLMQEGDPRINSSEIDRAVVRSASALALLARDVRRTKGPRELLKKWFQLESATHKIGVAIVAMGGNQGVLAYSSSEEANDE